MPSGHAAWITAAVREAHQQWPLITLSDGLFAAHLASLSVSDGMGLQTGDLYLACACAHREVNGLRAFDQLLVRRVPAWLRGVTRDASLVDEVCQAVRELALLSTDQRPPRIASYSGRGPLDAWLRVVAVREAVRLVAKTGKGHFGTAPVQPVLDPYLDALRRRHQPEMAAAVEAAIKMLDLRERNMLRLYYFDGLSIDQIAVSYQLSGATISRRLKAARAEILEHFTAMARKTLNLTEQELVSLVDALVSQIDVSILDSP